MRKSFSCSTLRTGRPCWAIPATGLRGSLVGINAVAACRGLSQHQPRRNIQPDIPPRQRYRPGDDSMSATPPLSVTACTRPRLRQSWMPMARKKDAVLPSSAGRNTPRSAITARPDRRRQQHNRGERHEALVCVGHRQRRSIVCAKCPAIGRTSPILRDGATLWDSIHCGRHAGIATCTSSVRRFERHCCRRGTLEASRQFRRSAQCRLLPADDRALEERSPCRARRRECHASGGMDRAGCRPRYPFSFSSSFGSSPNL